MNQYTLHQHLSGETRSMYSRDRSRSRISGTFSNGAPRSTPAPPRKPSRNKKDIDKSPISVNTETLSISKKENNDLLLQKIKDLTQKNEDLTLNNTNLKQKNEDLTLNNTDLKQKNKDLREKNKVLRQKNKDLREKNKDITQKSKDFIQTIKNLKFTIIKKDELQVVLTQRLDSCKKLRIISL